MKLTAVPNYNESVVSHGILKENRVVLGKRTISITLPILERMRPTCFVQPQGKISTVFFSLSKDIAFVCDPVSNIFSFGI